MQSSVKSLRCGMRMPKYSEGQRRRGSVYAGIEPTGVREAQELPSGVLYDFSYKDEFTWHLSLAS